MIRLTEKEGKELKTLETRIYLTPSIKKAWTHAAENTGLKLYSWVAMACTKEMNRANLERLRAEKGIK